MASEPCKNQSRRAFRCLAVGCCIFSSCVALAPDWRRDGLEDAAKLAQVICDEVLAVEADPARARQVATDLNDRRIIHTEVDPDGAKIEVTVRDIAFTILEESGIIDDRVDRKLKLLHGCQAGDEWIRIHIPVLDEEDFEAAQRQLQGK